MSYRLALTTCPDRETAEGLAASLVADRLAACVSIIPGVTSVYRWKGEVHKDEEFILLIKTRTEVYDALEEAIRERHPYELPEIIAIPIEMGLQPYLSWIDDSVG